MLQCASLTGHANLVRLMQLTDQTHDVQSPNEQAWDRQTIRDAILDLCSQRGTEKSICPSEVARQLRPDGDWRALMPAVRAEGARLAATGAIDVLRAGQRVSSEVKGPIRLKLTKNSANTR